MTDRLRLLFRARLIQTARGLRQEERGQLLFYCKDYISTYNVSFYSRNGGIMKLFSVLEESLVISWEDVSFLTEFLRIIRRNDLAVQLDAFELTRELMFYVMKRRGLRSCHSLSATEPSVSLYLVDVVKDIQDGDVEKLNSLVQAGFGLAEIWDEVSLATSDEEESVTSKKWVNLTLRVAFAGEVITALYSQDGNEALSVDMASWLANSLSSKISKLGNWKEFCDFVKNRYHQTCQVQELALRKTFIRDFVKKLKALPFFQ